MLSKLTTYVIIIHKKYHIIRCVLEASKESCDRECHELDWPLICRFKIVLETQKIQKYINKFNILKINKLVLQSLLVVYFKLKN